MLAPKAVTPTAASTDNGKQNTYFSSLDNMVAQWQCSARSVRNARGVTRGFSGDQHGRRRGRWSGCGDWSLMQNVYVKPPAGGFVVYGA